MPRRWVGTVSAEDQVRDSQSAGTLEELKIELTRKCPLECIHCSSNAGPDETGEMLHGDVFSLIGQACELGVRSLVFSGGEPLLWPWLRDAVRLSAEMSIHTSVYSTGNDGDGSGHLKIISLADAGLREIAISIFSSEPEVHDSLTRTRGSFSLARRALQAAQGTRLTRRIHVVPMKRTLAQLPGVLRLAAVLNVDKVGVLRLVPHRRARLIEGGRQLLTKHEMLILRTMLSKHNSQDGPTIRAGSAHNNLLLGQQIECQAATATVTVGVGGDVYPCDAFKNIDPSELGIEDPFRNALRRTLRECWHLSAYLNAVRKVRRAPTAEPCLNCNVASLCGSGCLAQKVIWKRTLGVETLATTPDPMCLQNSVENGLAYPDSQGFGH